MLRRGFDFILWDWNGTLMDDGPFGLGIINAMLRERGLREPDREEHRRLFDFPVSLYYERLGFNFREEPFEQVSTQFVTAYIAGAKQCPLREGARELLTELRASGYRQSILSASRQDYLEGFIEHYGLQEEFEELLGIDSEHAPGKAGRGMEWIRECSIDPARILLIGDTVHDAEVAEAMGVACWLIEGGHHHPERLRSTGRPLVADLGAVRRRLLETGGEIAC
ncbi:MAG: hypothetical protein RL648_986 [Verrucomicrobiota bacterium]|jgi:phosphoglycolate phosphatase